MFHSIEGRIFGYNENGLVFNGRPVGGSTPTGLGRGKTFYVDSAVAASDGTSPDTAVGTLAAALAKCTASQGDVVIIQPGHAESITSATALGFSVAGVTIIGLGTGAKRPTFTFTTANTATIAVSASSIWIENCIFIGNFLSIASCFTVGAAPDFTVNKCAFRDTSAILGFLSIITTTVSVNADGLTFSNNAVQSDATTTPGPTVVIAGTIDRLTIVGNWIVHTVASNNIAALLEHGALVVTHGLIAWNYVYSINSDTATGAILIKTTATTGSGIAMHNRVRALDVAAAIMITAAAVQWGSFDNLYTGDTAFSGFVLPAIATD